MDIINKINYLLEKNNLKQKDLTDYLGIEKSVFSSWKNGKSKSYLKYISQIAEFLNISVDSLTGDNIQFDFDLTDDSYSFIQCPICSCENVHTIKTIPADFKKSENIGIAVMFLCEEGHSFYQVFESYKGYTYTAFTDNLTVLSKINTDNIDYESAPYNLANAARADDLMEKYSVLDEHGKEIVDSIVSIEYKRYLNQQPDNEENLIDLRFYAYTAVSAGAGLYDDNNEYPTVKRVPDNAITKAADFCCYVKGDSMEPMYYDGDLICVKKQSSIEIGEIGIFEIDGNLFVKKLGSDGLISLNPKYGKKQSPNIICQGKVLGKI